MKWRRNASRGQGLDACWRPSRPDAKPYPWPWKTSLLWEESSSVLLRAPGKMVKRLLTVKERCQLMDLRADWGSTLLEAVWSWNDRSSVPLRLLVEFVMAASE